MRLLRVSAAPAPPCPAHNCLPPKSSLDARCQQGVDKLKSFPNSGAFEGAMLSATMLGFIIVLYFLIYSFCILVV